MHPLFIIIGVGVVVWLIAVVIGNIHSKKQEEEEEREKQKQEESFVKKVKETTSINDWADEIANHIEKYITSFPLEDSEFHFKAYEESFEYGIYLQDIWLPHTRKIISQKGHHCAKEYSFCQYGIPNLNRSGKQTDLFSMAVAELTAERLNKKGYSVEARKLIRVIDNKGYGVDGMDHTIGRIIYTPLKVQRKW